MNTVIQIALNYLDTPYAAGTLESDSECLCTRTDALDCVTFVETVLARYLTEKSGSFFETALQYVRYRRGKLNGYASRLHYTSDWIFDNEQKGLIQDITRDLGGVNWPLHVNFMTTHSELYPALKNPDTLTQMQAIESAINAREHTYIPTDKIKPIEGKIKDGDIIFFVTKVAGLDIAHLGFAYHTNNILTFIHASSKFEKVIVNPTSVAEYCASLPNLIGIKIARIKD